jgi:non-heme chloroperoxidase
LLELAVMTDRRLFIRQATAVLATVSLPALAHAKAQARIARVRTKDSTSLHVKVWGDRNRPAVILTHAWPLSADIWDLQAQALADRGYRVVAYDRRGFGRSDQPATGYDFDTFADDLASVIAELRLRDAAIFGYSMGGGEIVRYFSRHAGRHITKVGFVGAAASYALKTADNPDGLDAAVFTGMKQGVQKDRATYLAGVLRDVFFDVTKPATSPLTAQAMQRWLDVALQASVRATVECVDAFSATDFRPELAAVKAPALVLHGTADIPVPLALARLTARGIPGAKLVEYEGVSHGLVVTEAERVTRDMLSFLAS